MDPVTRLLDPAFLSANREGRLASRQESRLGDGAYRSRFDRTCAFIAAAGVALVAAVSAARIDANAGLDATIGPATPIDPERLTILLVALAVIGLAALVLRPWSDPLGADVRAGQVLRVTGSFASAAGGSGHVVTIEGLRFHVPSWLWSAVDEARVVTAYYLPRSMTLVSIEAADDLDSPPLLALADRRVPLGRSRRVPALYFGGVGLALLVLAWLPPVELVPELPAAVLFIAFAAVLARQPRN